MSSLLADFLNDNLPPLPPQAEVNGSIAFEPSDNRMEVDSSNNENDKNEIKAKEFVTNEYRLYSLYNNMDEENRADAVSSCADTLMTSEQTYENIVNVPIAFKKYRFDTYYRNSNLSIDTFRNKIVELVAVNSVVVIHGPTGCGKTTQVPQYIMDYCREGNLPCKIVVTQPRRIAAINIAQRVCQERGWSLGTVCGYQIGLNRQTGPDSILNYVTTEILLQMLINDKCLNNFTHIIIDEVHERNKALDFLLLIVRRFLFTNSPTVKVILMSATIEAEEFSYYFRSQTINTMGIESNFKAPILHINKKTSFVTNIFYMEQMSYLGQIPEYSIDSPEVHSELYHICFMLINAFDKLDETDSVTNQKIIGSVLVFLPGLHEIEETHKYLLKTKKPEGCHWDMIPIHSSLSREHQAKAFEQPKPGIRKIILSTNIAESSITVPDVYYVIDFCLTKVMTVNPITKFSTLALEWASHNNCIQRAGRVGRVANGRVYRLVPRDFYEKLMLSKTTPEMQRAPLENVILYMKSLWLNDKPKFILSLALSPPKLKDVDDAVLHLKEIGALLQTCEGEKDLSNGDITFLGTIMSTLPIDIHLSKLIVLGHMFSCLREAVVMAAGCTIQNLFVTTFSERIQCYRKRLIWADGSCSDFLTLLNLYDVWQASRRKNEFRSSNEENSWCKTNYINPKGLKDWQILINEINSRLQSYGIDHTTNVTKVVYTPSEKSIVLKVIISGAFYPNYFVKSNTEDVEEYFKNAVKTVNGRDPFKTIYFTNMHLNQPGQIYVREIKRLMNLRKDVEIGFDSSSKIYVEYKHVRKLETVHVNGNPYLTTVASNIPIDVYEAVRKRQLKYEFLLKILPEDKAWAFVNQLDEDHMNSDDYNCYSTPDYSPLPTLDIEYISVVITSRMDTGFFYCQNYSDDTTALLDGIFRVLNSSDTLLQQPKGRIELETKVYVTIFETDKKFYRCKVLELFPGNNNETYAKVRFIDYGNLQKIDVHYLFELPNNPICKVAPIAMCCVLSEVRLCIVGNDKALWTEDVSKIFRNKTDGILLHAKVYSVIDDILHLELYLKKPNSNSPLTSLNSWLVEQGYAEKSEESLISKLDHEKRLQVLNSDNPPTVAKILTHTSKMRNYQDFECPEIDESCAKIILKGPFNPLEIRVRGLTRATSGLSTHIDQSSVNAVLLDTNPEDPHARLLVAGQVIQTASGDRLKIGHTTLMPSIPGFPMFMALLFCPVMEPRLTIDGNRVGAILCGLGSQKNKMPVYGQHDLMMDLDVELTSNMFLKINELRFVMNKSMDIIKSISNEGSYPEALHQYQELLKKHLFELLHLKKTSVQPSTVLYGDSWGKLFGEGVEILRLNHRGVSTDIWQLQWFINLNNSYFRGLENNNLKDLHLMSKKVIPVKEIACQLCNSETLYDIREIRVHVYSSEHQTKYNLLKNQSI